MSPGTSPVQRSGPIGSTGVTLSTTDVGTRRTVAVDRLARRGPQPAAGRVDARKGVHRYPCGRSDGPPSGVPLLDDSREEQGMSTNRPDPGEFFERAQQVLRDLFAAPEGGDEPWNAATRPAGNRPASARPYREPSPEEQRENLTFALATRAVEALEDMALNVAAIRQRLERGDAPTSRTRPADDRGRDDVQEPGGDAPAAG